MRRKADLRVVQWRLSPPGCMARSIGLRRNSVFSNSDCISGMYEYQTRHTQGILFSFVQLNPLRAVHRSSS